MVKSLKVAKTKSSQLKVVDSHNNSVDLPAVQPMTSNEDIFIPREEEEDNYLKVSNSDKKQNKKKNKLSIDSDHEIKPTLIANIKENEKRKLKKKLSYDGESDLAKLVTYLYCDKPFVEKRVDLDDEEIELVRSLHKAVDLDKFFEPTEKKFNDKLWRIDYKWFKRDVLKEEKGLSENGFRVINRFGSGIPDNCNIKLSLSSKGKINFENYVKVPKQWNDILDKADDALCNYEHKGKNKSVMARRGSLIQPRVLFLTPHPVVGYEKVLQIANCLPLREWTSELFLNSKESHQLLDSETKRTLMWNASLEDFRHLLSPELSHFDNDIDSLIVQAKRRQSLYPPKHDKQPLNFRRKSYMGGAVWNTSLTNTKSKDNYEGKLGIIRQHSVPETNKLVRNVEKSGFGNSLLVPNEDSVFGQKKLNKKFTVETIIEISLDDIDARILANDLTLIMQELYLSIDNIEIISYMIRPNAVNPETCPHLTALFGFQKRIIQLLPYVILQQINAEFRAKKIAFFIQVAEELREMRNWQSLSSIIQSLQSPPIARLKQSWQSVSSDYSDQYCEYIELSQEIQQEDTLDSTLPSIQMFDTFIDDLKERCGLKLFEIKKHRLHGNWAKPESFANWVDNEIEDLVNTAKEKKKINKKIKKLLDSQTNKDKDKHKGMLSRLFRRESNNELMDGSNGSSKSRASSSASSMSPNSSSTSLESTAFLQSQSKLTKSMSYPRDIGNIKTIQTIQPSCKSNWNPKEVQELSEDQGKEIMQEITKGLVNYQKHLLSYCLDKPNKTARDFLLLQTYEEMDANMKKSLFVEPSVKKV